MTPHSSMPSDIKALTEIRRIVRPESLKDPISRDDAVHLMLEFWLWCKDRIKPNTRERLSDETVLEPQDGIEVIMTKAIYEKGSIEEGGITFTATMTAKGDGITIDALGFKIRDEKRLLGG